MTITAEFRRVIRRRWPLPDEAPRKMEGGYSLVLRPNADRWERKIYWERTYEPATLALIDACLRPGDRMIDVGANFGLMSLHASRAVGPSGTVTAIEPHPKTFRRLQDHLRMNGAANIRCINVAAGAEKGALEIFDTPKGESGQASLIPESDSVPAGSVDVRRLDDIVGPIKGRTFIKIDVEGFEHHVLLGASETLKADPIICMECDPGLHAYSSDALAALRLVLATERFDLYRFAGSKSTASPCLTPAAEDYWLRTRHQNAIFIPHSLRGDLPALLFN